MLKSHCSSQLVLLGKMFAVNLFITLGESVFRNIDRPCLLVYFLCIFVLFYFLCIRQKGRQKQKEGNLMEIVYFY